VGRHSYVDPTPALLFCGAAQHYLDSLTTTPSQTKKKNTQVLAASFTTPDQAMQLAGVHHITLSPALLATLAETPASSWTGGAASVGQAARVPPALGAKMEEKERELRVGAVLREEAVWRMAVTRAEGGKAEGKLVQAINIFCDAQESLEGIVKRADAEVRGAAAAG
jgi:transaldolase